MCGTNGEEPLQVQSASKSRRFLERACTRIHISILMSQTVFFLKDFRARHDLQRFPSPHIFGRTPQYSPSLSRRLQYPNVFDAMFHATLARHL